MFLVHAHPKMTAGVENQEQNGQPLLIPGQLLDGSKIIHPTDQVELPTEDILSTEPFEQSIDNYTATTTEEQHTPPLLGRSPRIRNPPKVLTLSLHLREMPSRGIMLRPLSGQLFGRLFRQSSASAPSRATFV